MPLPLGLGYSGLQPREGKNGPLPLTTNPLPSLGPTPTAQFHPRDIPCCMSHASNACPPLLEPPSLLQDVVERFQLVTIMFFIVVEDMDNSATWTPNATLM